MESTTTRTPNSMISPEATESVAAQARDMIGSEGDYG